MDDGQTTIAEIRAAVGCFVQERAWEKYHTPKNLAMSVAIEAAELMEHFQWLTPEEAQQAVQDPQELAAVAAEIADVAAYLFALCNVLKVDLSTAVREKLERNRQRFPVERCYGEYRRQMKAEEEAG